MDTEHTLANDIARQTEMRRRLIREVTRRAPLRRDPIQGLLENAPLFDPSPLDWPEPSPVPGSDRPINRVSFSARFAPAHPLESENQRSTRIISNNRQDDEINAPLSLLHRAGYSSVADTTDPAFRPIVDGLGDRARSLTPDDLNEDDDEDDDEMHDAWETLLTTIQPDEQLPSASSSFASATATSGLTNSMDSTLTAPSSFGSVMAGMHIFPDQFTDFNCEYPPSSDGSDTEAEPETEETNQRRENGSSRRRQRGEGETALTSTRDATQQENQSQARDTEQSTPSITTSLTDTLGPEFQQVHSILDRLSRRDDIPDEWWETAGLSRIIRRELNNSRSDADPGA